jgi:hypothetical protein
VREAAKILCRAAQVLDLPHVRAYLRLEPDGGALEALGVGHQTGRATDCAAGFRTDQNARAGGQERYGGGFHSFLDVVVPRWVLR